MKLQDLVIGKVLRNLDFSKATQESNIKTDIIKDNIDIFAPILYQEFR